MSLNDNQRKQYMHTLRNFMFSDAERGIKAGLNYLVALGLSAYTEILGGLLRGNFEVGAQYEQNYISFIKKYFDEKCGFKYMEVNKQLRPYKGLYGAVRSGFVHGYLLNKKGFVGTYSPTTLPCAIIYTPGKDPEIQFAVEEYLNHFKCAFEKYYDELINQKDPHLTEAFDKAEIMGDLV